MQRTIAVTVMCVAMMLMGAHARADDAQNRCTRIGQKWVKFWNSLNVQKAADMFSDVFTEDIVYNDIPTDPENPVAEGRDELLAFARGLFGAFPTSHFELGRSACRGQQRFFRMDLDRRGRPRGPPAPGFCGTGKPFTVRGVAVIAIQDKRISRNADFWDLATVLRQLLPDDRPDVRECVAGLVGLGE